MPCRDHLLEARIELELRGANPENHGCKQAKKDNHPPMIEYQSFNDGTGLPIEILLFGDNRIFGKRGIATHVDVRLRASSMISLSLGKMRLPSLACVTPEKGNACRIRNVAHALFSRYCFTRLRMALDW